MHSGGAALPFVISHYFDINQKSRNGIYGRGWNISLNQEVEMLSGYTADACYTDEQGKKHYFVTENGSAHLPTRLQCNGFILEKQKCYCA